MSRMAMQARCVEPESEPREINAPRPRPKFEAYGEEMIERQVKPSGKSGRVYLPTDWVGKNVKIILMG